MFVCCSLTCVILHHVLVVSVGGGEVHAAGPEPKQGGEGRLTLTLQLEHFTQHSITINTHYKPHSNLAMFQINRHRTSIIINIIYNRMSFFSAQIKNVSGIELYSRYHCRIITVSTIRMRLKRGVKVKNRDVYWSLKTDLFGLISAVFRPFSAV